MNIPSDIDVPLTSQEDKEVVNWFVDKADKTFCSIAGGEAESFVPSVSWNPVEVYKWVAKFNENTACVLLRNKINGDKLFRLNTDRLCDVYDLSLDDALELMNNIEGVNSIQHTCMRLFDFLLFLTCSE